MVLMLLYSAKACDRKREISWFRQQNYSLTFLVRLTQGCTLTVFFLTCMRGWLVGCQFKDQVFPSGKVFVLQTVVWYKFLVNFSKGGKNKDCVGLYFPPRAEAVYGFSCFITTNKQTNKKSIGYPLSVFNRNFYPQTRCQTDTGKKVMYPGM